MIRPRTTNYYMVNSMEANGMSDRVKSIVKRFTTPHNHSATASAARSKIAVAGTGSVSVFFASFSVISVSPWWKRRRNHRPRRHRDHGDFKLTHYPVAREIMTSSRINGIIDIPSNHSVDETVEKLKGILQDLR